MNIWKILSILYFFAAFNVVELEGKSVNSNQMVECTYPKYPTKCVCPGNCMTQYKNTSKCEVKNCYSWDENLGKCMDSGKDFTTAMILQGIPFTGAFGSTRFVEPIPKRSVSISIGLFESASLDMEP